MSKNSLNIKLQICRGRWCGGFGFFFDKHILSNLQSFSFLQKFFTDISTKISDILSNGLECRLDDNIKTKIDVINDFFKNNISNPSN